MKNDVAEECLTENAIEDVLYSQVGIGLDVAHASFWIIAVSNHAVKVEGTFCHLSIHKMVIRSLWNEQVNICFSCLVQGSA